MPEAAPGLGLLVQAAGIVILAMGATKMQSMSASYEMILLRSTRVSDDDRVELVAGESIDMAPIGSEVNEIISVASFLVSCEAAFQPTSMGIMMATRVS